MIDFMAFEAGCTFKTSRSGGKGGQNVNKTETKVGLWFDIAASELFSDEEKERIFKRLASYITDEKCLQLTCDTHRSQLQNKHLVVRRAISLINGALIVNKPRKPSKPSRLAVERRLEEKRKNAQKKMYRNDSITE
ncbi:MAG: aminoacyl-tRNA hydrolase [Prevotellaceae bacterium]|jgi:ribosome-associated protein|nr:aminoacyl-tRNA hydrolase [Prevotellaceae bacterium]